MKVRVTIKDIAKESGVSITTVSRIINNKTGYCSKETEKKIRDAIKRLDYRPNLIARSLVTNRSSLIGVIFPDIYNNYFQDLFKGIEDYVSSYGYKLILCNTGGDKDKESGFVHSMYDNLVDGIIISTSNGIENNHKIRELYDRGFPIVAVERYGEELDPVPQVLFANREAEVEAVEYLYQKGHRKIAYIAGPQRAVNARHRLEGFLAGFYKVGLEVDHALIFEGDYQLASGRAAAESLLQKGEFTAVVAANDLMAVGAHQVFLEKGIRIPHDISVIGCDGTMLAELINPRIGTVELNGYQMGEKAGEMMMKQIRKEEIHQNTEIFQPKLKVENSVRDLKFE